MADPRGRGFKRGRGKWHAPTVKETTIDPASFGWEPDGEGGWTLGQVCLAEYDTGFMAYEDGGKQFIPAAMLQQETAFIKLATLAKEPQPESVQPQGERPDGATHLCSRTGSWYKYQGGNTQIWRDGEWQYYPYRYPPESTERV